MGVESGYSHGDNLLMFVADGHVKLYMVSKHSFGVWSTICISNRDWSVERNKGNVVSSNKAFVDGRTGAAAVYKDFGGNGGMSFFLMDLDRKGELTSMSSNECSVRICWYLDFR